MMEHAERVRLATEDGTGGCGRSALLPNVLRLGFESSANEADVRQPAAHDAVPCPSLTMSISSIVQTRYINQCLTGDRDAV